MIGCGTAGPAAALALARAGNEVVMLEATPVLADLHPGLHGLGVHRGALFTVLRAALDEAGIEVRCGVTVRGLERAGRAWGARDAEGTAHGPFDLVVVADGVRSRLRGGVAGEATVRRYPWGALWATIEDPDTRFAGALHQVYHDVRLTRWQHEGVALVGDAAHAMSPQLGQGVSLALLESLAGTRSGLVGAQKQKSSTTSK